MKKLFLENRRGKVRAKLYHGNALKVLKTLPDNCIHSIVTDPPYGLSFMGKHWDYDVPSIEIWEECLRVLKPGGYLLAFAGTRTQHRMAVRIEDAGFEIRDMIAWVYGSGFPKSMNVSKAIDKAAGAERKIVGVKAGHEEFVNRKTKGHLDFKDGSEGFDRPWMHDDKKREAYHMQTAAATKDAQRWEGWGTALKPALEPITVARKPIIGTVADNVLEHGVGGLNIEACRVPVDPHVDAQNMRVVNRNVRKSNDGRGMSSVEASTPQLVLPEGRFPANFIHDGSGEVTTKFPRTQSGSTNIKRDSGKSKSGNTGSAYGAESRDTGTQMIAYGDVGSASRFFYCAKANKSDRDEGLEDFELKHASGLPMRSANGERGGKGLDGTNTDRTTTRANNHPTVKPTDLMRYLSRLVTPPNGWVLDPFMGSGSTGKAAIQEGFRFVGIDRELDYCKISAARIRHALENYLDKVPTLFKE